MSRYLTDLADVCRRAGLDVIEMDGWQNRARGSGGYSSGRPTHVMVHHTASGPSSDGWPDANYCTFGSENRPVANLYLNRAGTVWVMAAGATNTNGSGGPLDNVPADSMNTHAIGIEAGNGGTGEPWPTTQQDAYLTLSAELCRAYAIPTGHIRSHAEWAPGRKIDPAGPSRWAPSGTWPMAGFRADTQAAIDGGGPSIGLEVPDMLQIFTVTDSNYPGAVYVSTGMAYRHLDNPDALAALTLFMTHAGLDTTQRSCTRNQIDWAGAYITDEGRSGPNPYL